MKFILLTIVEYFIILFVNVVHAVYTTIYGKIEFDSSPCSFEVEDAVEEPNCTKPRRNHRTKAEEYHRTLMDGIYTVDEALREAVKRFGRRKCFGFRKTKIVHSKWITMPDGRLKEWFTPEFESPQFWTYNEVCKKIRDFGSGLVKFAGLKEREIFGIFEDTRPEWMIAAHGAIQQNIIITTVYANLGEQSLIKALNETEVTCLMLNAKDVPRVNEMAKFIPNLKYLIYTDKLKENAIKGKLNLQVMSFEEVIELGKLNYHEPKTKSKPDDLLLIMYTSGSTGNPKGVMLTHQNVMAGVAGSHHCIGPLKKEDVYMAYLPLAHIFEFMCENMVLQKGGLICFGTPRTLADTGAIPCGDLVAFKPTTFIAVPKVCDTIKKAALEKVEKNPIAKFLFGIAFRDKLKAITEGRDTPVWDNLIFSQFKERMGGNIRLFVTGSAPLNEETHQFLRVCIGAPVVQGYGLTETTASGTVQWKGHRFSTCNVGCVNPCGIIKLRDVPELGYKSTDKPFPRGEILMKGYHVAKGYYKNPELTKEYFLEDGWFCTGDVGQWLPDGSLQIIDRKKNLIKMAHGEYIATEALENIYGQSPFVSPNGILVYGDSFKDDLVAIIVPQTSYLQYWAKKNHIEGTLNDLCNHPKIKEAVKKSLNEMAEKHGRKKFEYIKNFKLVTDEWTPENGLLSSSQKLKRASLVARYKVDINEMYETLVK